MINDPFPQKSRAERIAEFRQGQPLEVLRMKAEIARRRSGELTQEDLDWCIVEGRRKFLLFCGIATPQNADGGE